jgi:hypothetical protein
VLRQASRIGVAAGLEDLLDGDPVLVPRGDLLEGKTHREREICWTDPAAINVRYCEDRLGIANRLDALDLHGNEGMSVDPLAVLGPAPASDRVVGRPPLRRGSPDRATTRSARTSASVQNTWRLSRPVKIRRDHWCSASTLSECLNAQPELLARDLGRSSPYRKVIYKPRFRQVLWEPAAVSRASAA